MHPKATVADWQPIETAPRDGRQLLLCRAGFLAVIGCWLDLWELRLKYPDKLESRGSGAWMTVDPGSAFANDQDLLEYLSFESDYEPTHWAPAPEGPTPLLEVITIEIGDGADPPLPEAYVYPPGQRLRVERTLGGKLVSIKFYKVVVENGSIFAWRESRLP